MTKIISVKEDKESNQFYFDLNDFSDIVDISLVEYYELNTEGEKLVLIFYDKEKNIIKPKGH